MTQPDQYGNYWDEALQAYVGVGSDAGRYYADGRWFDSLGALNVYRSLIGGGDTNEPNVITQTSGGVTRGIDKNTGKVLWETPTGGGGSTSVTVHNTPIQQQGGRYRTAVDDSGGITGIPGAVYQEDTFDGSISIVSKPAASASGDPRDKNNDGLVDSTGASIYVYQDASSPSGYWLDNADGTRVPTLRNGALFTGDSGREPSAGPTVNGVPYVWDPTSKKYIPAPGIPGAAGGIPEPPAGPSYKGVPYVWDSKKGEYVPAPGLHGIPDQGTGGGYDPMSSMVTAQINANSRAASDAAAAQRAAASASARSSEIAQQQGFQSAEAEAARQFAREQQEKADALRIALDRPGYEMARSRFQLEMQEGKLRAADSVAAHISDTDPGAYAAFLAAGGGNVANAIASGGNAVSDKAKLGAARSLAASEQPIDLPPTWEELFPSSGALRLGAGGIPSGGTTGATGSVGGNASPTGATNVTTQAPDLNRKIAASLQSPIPAMQTNFDFTPYGGPKVDYSNAIEGTMTRLLGPGGGMVQDSAPPVPQVSTGGPGGVGPAFPIQDAAPTVMPGLAGGAANPYASMPDATRAALLAGGGLDPAVQAQLQALVPRKAMGGPADEPLILVGEEGPELIANPLEAPLDVLNNQQTRVMLGKGIRPPGYVFGTDTFNQTVQRVSGPLNLFRRAPAPVPAPTPAPTKTSTVATPISSPPPSTTVSSPPSTATAPVTTTAPAPAVAPAAPPPPLSLPTFQNTSPVPLSTPPPTVATAPQPAPVPATAATAPVAVPTTAPPLAAPPAATGGLQAPAAAAVPTALPAVQPPAPTTNAGALANFAATQATVNTAGTAPQDIITPEDRAYLDRIGAIRAGAQFPELNPYATDFWYQDPTVREMFLKGRQTKLGIPFASSVWDAQRFAIPGMSRGSLRIGR